MTDNPLVEAVSMPLHPANRSDADLQRDHSPEAAQEIKRRNDMATIIPTAALRAIEDAGWKVVPVEATPDMENAAYEVQVKGADPHDFTAHDCAKDIWAAMIAAAPTG